MNPLPASPTPRDKPSRGAHIASNIACAIDRHLEGRGFGFFYEHWTSRPWLYMDMFREPGAWTVHLGKFEFVWDRPQKVQRG